MISVPRALNYFQRELLYYLHQHRRLINWQTTLVSRLLTRVKIIVKSRRVILYIIEIPVHIGHFSSHQRPQSHMNCILWMGSLWKLETGLCSIGASLIKSLLHLDRPRMHCSSTIRHLKVRELIFKFNFFSKNRVRKIPAHLIYIESPHILTLSCTTVRQTAIAIANIAESNTFSDKASLCWCWYWFWIY